MVSPVLSVIVVNCNLIISEIMAAWPIKFTEGSKPGKKHPLRDYLSSYLQRIKKPKKGENEDSDSDQAIDSDYESDF